MKILDRLLTIIVPCNKINIYLVRISLHNFVSCFISNLQKGVFISMSHIKKEQNKQYIHISFDDVYACLKDITEHADTYTTIFDNDFFAWLKEMNQSYGAVFTLYTFNYDSHAPEYDISKLPARYAQQLAASSAWLKFAFHAKDNLKKYDTDDAEGIKADYEKFTTAVLRATGGCTQCIDRVNRLGFFAGSKANVEALQKCEHGLLGLLTADNSEERISYYFDAEKTKLLNQVGEYADAENGLLFLRSQLRLESVASLREQYERIKNYTAPKVIELFTHEQCFFEESHVEGYTVQGLLEEYIKWAYEEGYGFDFAMNRYHL